MDMATGSSRSAPHRILKSRKNIGTVPELCPAHEIEYCDMMEEMLCFIKQTAADDLGLPADRTELAVCTVERLPKVGIPVCDFQEADDFEIHRARCTETNPFRNGHARNDWVWL